MRLLFDQNISFRIIKKISESYPEAKQVRELGLENSSDFLIWQYAKVHGYCQVTFDSDFIDISTLRGFPPKVIWLKMGNTSTDNIARRLLAEKENISEFLEDATIAFYELH